MIANPDIALRIDALQPIGHELTRGLVQLRGELNAGGRRHL